MRVCDLFDALQQTPEGLSFHTAAQVMRLPKPAALRYVGTLLARGYVERDPGTRMFRVGPSFMPLRCRQPRSGWPAP